MAQELKDIKIGQPAIRALNEANIHTFMQLCDYTEMELLALHAIGPKAIRVIKESLAKEGLSLK
jgi:DNA-directed RNA polymerase alpha subunit